MKLRQMILPAILLIAPVALQASSKNSEKVTFDENVTVGETEIPAGDYRVRWEGTGTYVEVSISQGKTLVASAPATLVEGKTPFGESVDLKKEGKTTIVKVIRWKNRSLYFDQADGSSDSTLVGGANK